MSTPQSLLFFIILAIPKSWVLRRPSHRSFGGHPLLRTVMSHSWSSSESFETGETDQECDPFFSEYFYQQRRQNSIDGYVTDASDHFTIDPRSPQFDAGQLRELPSVRAFSNL